MKVVLKKPHLAFDKAQWIGVAAWIGGMAAEIGRAHV